MAVIIYKGQEYPINYQVSYEFRGSFILIYCNKAESTNNSVENLPNGVFCRGCYLINREIVNNPLEKLRDFLLVNLPCIVSILKKDFTINLDKGGGSRESAE